MAEFGKVGSPEFQPASYDNNNVVKERINLRTSSINTEPVPTVIVSPIAKNSQNSNVNFKSVSVIQPSLPWYKQTMGPKDEETRPLLYHDTIPEGNEEPDDPSNALINSHKQDIDPSLKSEAHIMGGMRSRLEKIKVKIMAITIPKKVINLILSVTTIFAFVCMQVSLPMYTKAMNDQRSDPYNAMLFSAFWFPWVFFLQLAFIKLFIDRELSLKPKTSWSGMFLTGALTAVNGLLIAYASLPSRTPPYLQAIFTTTLIPFTILARLIILRKGVRLRQLVVCGIILIGMFISVEPQIFGLEKGGESGGAHGFFWPMIFMLGFIPNAVAAVVTERELKSEQANSMVFIAWTQVFMYSTVLLLFWTDFIPNFGMATSPADFFNRFKTGLVCQFGIDHSCSNVAGLSWMFILSYCFANLSNFLLIRYAEGAVYSVVVMALVTPLGTIFWNFFSLNPHFHFHPHFDQTSIYIFVGLLIMTPAVVVYTVFSMEEEAEAAMKESSEPPPPKKPHAKVKPYSRRPKIKPLGKLNDLISKRLKNNDVKTPLLLDQDVEDVNDNKTSATDARNTKSSIPRRASSPALV